MNINKTCLLITGCINPDNRVPVLALSNAQARREQYVESLKYYIECSKYRNIVFCENSSSVEDNSIKEKANKLNKNFEWISFSGNVKKTILHGKGYGEGEIVEYALTHSKILSRCDTFVKVTGRLIVHNINWCIRLKTDNGAYFDISREYVDTRMYIMPVKFYNRFLISTYKEVNDNERRYLEHVIFEKMKLHPQNFKQIPFYVNIEGQSGSKGSRYEKENNTKTILKSIKKMAKAIVIRYKIK